MKSRILPAITAIILVLLLTAPAVSAANVTLSSGEIATVGGETTLYLVLDHAPDGLSGYNTNLTVSNPSVIQVTDISFAAWASQMNDKYFDAGGDRILVKASDVNNGVKAGAANAILAAVTVRGLARGTTSITLSQANFDREDGTDMPVTLRNSAVAVNISSGTLPFDSQVVNYSIPGTIRPLRNMTVTIVMNNTGLLPWMNSSSGSSGVYLDAAGGTSGDAAKFGFSRMYLPDNYALLTGNTYVFNFTLRAPNETGIYYPAWQMRSDSKGLFGAVVNVSVNVSRGQPVIQFTGPADDNYAGETVTFNGTVLDATISSVMLKHNNLNLTPAPVVNGNFSGSVALNTGDVLKASAYDHESYLEEAYLWFDGDRLPGFYEESIGFNPQNADSDNTLTAPNEAGNGIKDGDEKLDGKLPVFVKYRLGADAFRNDTDNDTLTDEFELLKLGLLTNVTYADSDNDGVSDANEDPDNDTVVNSVEQQKGSDPLLADSDGDTLTDPDEITRGTNPALRDSDNDALDDDSEVRLGTNPLVVNSDSDGIPDGNESYISNRTYFGSSLILNVTGIGDAAKRATVSNVNYTQLIPNTILVSNVSAVTFGNDTQSSIVKIRYFPAQVPNHSNLSMYVKNETSGSFDSITPSTIDTTNKIVSSTVTVSGEYCVMDKNLWNARFAKGDATAAQMAMMSMAAPGSTTNLALDAAVLSPVNISTSVLVTASGLVATSHVSEVLGVQVLSDELSQQAALQNASAPLIEGVDYGPNTSIVLRNHSLDIIDFSETPLTTSIGDSSSVNGVSGAPLLASAVPPGYYEVVSNGDFSNQMVNWVPSSAQSGSNSNLWWEAGLINTNAAYPPALRVSVGRPVGSTSEAGAYSVVQPELDFSHATSMSFNFKCDEWVDGDATINGYMMEILVRNRTRGSSSEAFLYWYPPNNQPGATTSPWTSITVPNLNQKIPASDSKDPMDLVIRVSYSATNQASSKTGTKVTFLVDDISVLSTEPPKPPNHGEVDFKIIDENSLPVTGGGTVYVYNSLGNMQQKTIRTGGTVGGTTEAFILTPGQWTYDIHFADQTKYTDINGRSLTVNAYDRKTVTVQIGTLPQTGSLTVYSIPTGADIYIDNVLQGQTPKTISDILEGSHTLTLKKADYRDNTSTVSVTAGSADSVSRELIARSTDNDTITDPVEREYFDQYGNKRSSDPTKDDTDADGNDDGVEAGTLIVTKDGHTIWKITGDALKTDTDGDGASDYIEWAVYGTDPMTAPADLAPEIISGQTITIHTDAIHLKVYCRMGAAFGETGIKDGTMNWLVGDTVASSFPYFTGWMASGFVVVGDVRDIGETLYQGDGTGTALNTLAFAPYVGDSTKTIKTVSKLTTKYPAKARTLGLRLSREVFDVIPSSYTKREIWQLCLSPRENEIITKLMSEGKTVDDILPMVKSEKGLIKSNLENTIVAYNNIPGNLNKFKAIRKKTVLGPYIEGSSESYQRIAYDLGSNCLNIDKSVTQYSWETNKMLLDMASDNGDEVVLTVKQISKRGDWSETLRNEVAYIEEKGYTLLPSTFTYHGNTGTYQLFKMVKA